MGEGRGMGRPSGWCICSVASSAVNSHGWTHTHTQTDLNTGQIHTLTFALAVVWVWYSSAPWCSALRFLSQSYGGKSFRFCVLLQSEHWRMYER